MKKKRPNMKGCPICGGPIRSPSGLQRCSKCGHLMYGFSYSHISKPSAREQLDEEYENFEIPLDSSMTSFLEKTKH